MYRAIGMVLATLIFADHASQYDAAGHEKRCLEQNGAMIKMQGMGPVCVFDSSWTLDQLRRLLSAVKSDSGPASFVIGSKNGIVQVWFEVFCGSECGHGEIVELKQRSGHWKIVRRGVFKT